MIHIFNFLGEGGAKLELRLDDGKDEIVEQASKSHGSYNDIKKRHKHVNPPNLASTKQMLSDIREEEGQKERERILNEGINKKDKL